VIIFCDFITLNYEKVQSVIFVLSVIFQKKTIPKY